MRAHRLLDNTCLHLIFGVLAKNDEERIS